MLGKVDMLIKSFSSRTYVRNLGLDTEDLVQEGRLKVLEIISNNPTLPMVELIALAITSVMNLYRKFIRTSKLEKNSGLIVDIDELYSVGVSDDIIGKLYIELQLDQLWSILSRDERKVLECIIFPDGSLIDMAIRKYGRGKCEVRITRELIGRFLDISKSEVNRLMYSIRDKAVPILNPQSC